MERVRKGSRGWRGLEREAEGGGDRGWRGLGREAGGGEG